MGPRELCPVDGLLKALKNLTLGGAVRTPAPSDSRVSTFQATLVEIEPWARPFRVSWYEPNTLPGNEPALGLQGPPIPLLNWAKPVDHESICWAAPMVELEESWKAFRGPFAETIASRVAGFRTPKKPIHRLGAAPVNKVAKSAARMSGNVSLVVAFRNWVRSPRSTMYSAPGGLFW